MLKQQLESLQAELYRGNFNASQDNNKFTRFTSRLRLPVYGTAPAKCEQGEVYVNSANGKLYVCSSANTWTAQT
jgi:hypothetical protein